MTRIGLLSDTHAYWDDRYSEFFSNCDEIWHAGDIGSMSIIDKLGASGKTMRAVYGNIDGQDIRQTFPLHNRFLIEQVAVWLTHIGGYPKKYNPAIVGELKLNPPKLFICGHSHIAKVMYDNTLQLLHINPGAAGNQGFHAVRTLMRFVIDKDVIKDLEIIELT
ncbi:MAG: metallophosphoesterase family protein [Paludibacteraceae bacterium]|nr:metallophosphoesterase family protein [Paludibacteraceae bacterium]